MLVGEIIFLPPLTLDHSETFVYMTLKFLIQSHSLQRSSSSLETHEMARHCFVSDRLQRSQATFQVTCSYLVTHPVTLSHYLITATLSTNDHNL